MHWELQPVTTYDNEHALKVSRCHFQNRFWRFSTHKKDYKHMKKSSLLCDLVSGFLVDAGQGLIFIWIDFSLRVGQDVFGLYLYEIPPPSSWGDV